MHLLLYLMPTPYRYQKFCFHYFWKVVSSLKFELTIGVFIWINNGKYQNNLATPIFANPPCHILSESAVTVSLLHCDTHKTVNMPEVLSAWQIYSSLANKKLEYYFLLLFQLFQHDPVKLLTVNNCQGFYVGKMCFFNLPQQYFCWGDHFQGK